MKLFWVMSLLLPTAILFAQDKKEPAIKVYIYDKDKNLLSLKDVEVWVILEVDTVGRKVLTTRRIESEKPAGRKYHGGEVDDQDGYFVELVVDESLRDDDPHVKANVSLHGLACAMRCQFMEKEGPCPKCGMKVQSMPYYFTAVIVFRINGEARNVKFRYPPPAVNYKEAVESLERYVEKLNQTDRHPPLNANIRWLSERIREDLAPADDRLEVAKLADAIDELAQNDSQAQAYKEKIVELKKRIKKEKEDH